MKRNEQNQWFIIDSIAYQISFTLPIVVSDNICQWEKFNDYNSDKKLR